MYNRHMYNVSYNSQIDCSSKLTKKSFKNFCKSCKSSLTFCSLLSRNFLSWRILHIWCYLLKKNALTKEVWYIKSRNNYACKARQKWQQLFSKKTTCCWEIAAHKKYSDNWITCIMTITSFSSVLSTTCPWIMVNIIT